ncbi:BppU family phage baseplate upper protein [Clostridium perfringens]|uniref:BppU family phage baseplate upper protein n=1 Tax=Clostridium perfringens TaxID=1502 RepID=UPI0028648880|nr:BppU family phage baseplate upper protein [Clostridium perfringens]
MSEIGLNINVDSYDNEGIKTIKGNNNAEIYKLYILKNKRRLSLVGKTVKLGYVMAGTSKGDIIENLNITNAEQGEITFPITNKISKKDGVHTCQLAIYGADGFLEYTATFGLTVEANIFTKIAGEIENSKDLTYIERILEEAKTVSEDLKTNIPVATNLNSSLESNISNARNINTTLADTAEKSKVATTDAIEKKSQLESSIVEAKKFIDGLDGSQDIPSIRMELTKLQNGLKGNQALAYQGSSIAAENTLEGRTEGMKIGGRTLKNLLGRTYSNYYSLITDIKPNTIYTVIKFNNRNKRVGIFKDNSSIAPIEEYTDRMVFSFNSGTMDDYKSLRFYQDANMGGVIEDDKNIIILEGDYTKTNNCIPNYFE